MLDRNNLVALAIKAVSADPSAPVAYSFGEDKFSYTELNDLLRSELRELAGTYALYRENKNAIFALMEQVLDDVLPKKVLDQYGAFADIRTFAQGDKPVFRQRISADSKARAKKFVTKVGLAGKYEVFRLDGQTLEVQTTAYGGAAQIAFEEFLDGRIDMADVLDIVMEGLDESIYKEIEKALIASVTTMNIHNKHVGDAFSETEMDRLIQVADSYGRSTIYCTYEFAATMVPASGWVSDDMRNEKWANGYLANYKGHNVIVLQQSMVDTANAEKVIDPAYAWIIPTGAEKPVKIAFEGATAVREFENHDWSREIQVYKKFGVALMASNAICVFKNTSLVKSVGYDQ